MKWLRGVLFVLLLAVLSTALWKEVTSLESIEIREIKISGVSAPTEARLRKVLEPTLGGSLWKIPVHDAAQTLKKDPWVESVDVRRQFPHTLAVDVSERRPFAILGNGSGEFKFVDESSVVIDRALPQDLGQYPVLMGQNFENKDLRAQAIDLLKSLPAEGSFSRSDIGDLQFDEEHGFRLTITGHSSTSGLEIDIGKDNLPLHIDRARRVVQYLDEHHLNASRVDSDYAKKVLVKVRKDR